ncbi:unnamed protein product [Amoebophrya sp. A120]|nr:unnamed protein product [Amoebophrya sp. A120]|eukprot:GSA120T00023738001.1
MQPSSSSTGGNNNQRGPGGNASSPGTTNNLYPERDENGQWMGYPGFSPDPPPRPPQPKSSSPPLPARLSINPPADATYVPNANPQFRPRDWTTDAQGNPVPQVFPDTLTPGGQHRMNMMRIDEVTPAEGQPRLHGNPGFSSADRINIRQGAPSNQPQRALFDPMYGGPGSPPLNVSVMSPDQVRQIGTVQDADPDWRRGQTLRNEDALLKAKDMDKTEGLLGGGDPNLKKRPELIEKEAQAGMLPAIVTDPTQSGANYSSADDLRRQVKGHHNRQKWDGADDPYTEKKPKSVDLPDKMAKGFNSEDEDEPQAKYKNKRSNKRGRIYSDQGGTPSSGSGSAKRINMGGDGNASDGASDGSYRGNLLGGGNMPPGSFLSSGGADSDGTPGSEYSAQRYKMKPGGQHMPNTPSEVSSAEAMFHNQHRGGQYYPGMTGGATGSSHNISSGASSGSSFNKFNTPTPGNTAFGDPYSMYGGGSYKMDYAQKKAVAKGAKMPAGGTPFGIAGPLIHPVERYPNPGFLKAKTKLEFTQSTMPGDPRKLGFVEEPQPTEELKPYCTRIATSGILVIRVTAYESLQFYTSETWKRTQAQTFGSCTQIHEFSYRMWWLATFSKMLEIKYKNEFVIQFDAYNNEIRRQKNRNGPVESLWEKKSKMKYEADLCDPTGQAITKEQWKEIKMYLKKWKLENDSYRAGNHFLQKALVAGEDLNQLNLETGRKKRPDDVGVQEVVHDNLCKSAIRRLARRGGVRRVSAKIYQPIRLAFQQWLEKVTEQTYILTSHQGRATVRTNEVINALKLQGKNIYGYGTTR